MLTKEQAQTVYDGLSIGYKRVESRMQFSRERSDSIDDSDVCQHVIGLDLPKEYQGIIPSYTNVSAETRALVDPFLDKARQIIDAKVSSAQQKFLIMSSNWCGKSRHFKHIHTLIQNNPQRCITLSLTLPLYVDEDENTPHTFSWYSQSELFPKITYTSQRRMEKLQVPYEHVSISTSKIMSLVFDSSRSPHWINNTGHLILWIVCDGVVLKDRRDPSSELILGMHDV
jgi:hypothetical protein